MLGGVENICHLWYIMWKIDVGTEGARALCEAPQKEMNRGDRVTDLEELKKEWMKDPEFVKEYEALEEEFSLASALISARSQANMTQQDVAEKMETSQSYIAKLEGGTVSPTMKALKRYAAATGSRLKIVFEPTSPQ